jgi:hypothetical protein
MSVILPRISQTGEAIFPATLHGKFQPVMKLTVQ